MDFAKRLVEVEEVLKYLSEEEREKIPNSVFEYIEKNKDKYYMEKIKIFPKFPKSENPLLRNCVLVLISGVLLFGAITVYDNRETVLELFSDENRIIKVEHDQVPGRIVSITSKERLLPTRIWVDDITVTVSVDLPNGASTYKTYSATCNRLGTGGFRSLSIGQSVYVGYIVTIYADGHKDYELGNFSY